MKASSSRRAAMYLQLTRPIVSPIQCIQWGLTHLKRISRFKEQTHKEEYRHHNLLSRSKASILQCFNRRDHIIRAWLMMKLCSRDSLWEALFTSTTQANLLASKEALTPPILPLIESLLYQTTSDIVSKMEMCRNRNTTQGILLRTFSLVIRTTSKDNHRHRLT